MRAKVERIETIPELCSETKTRVVRAMRYRLGRRILGMLLMTVDTSPEAFAAERVFDFQLQGRFPRAAVLVLYDLVTTSMPELASMPANVREQAGRPSVN